MIAWLLFLGGVYAASAVWFAVEGGALQAASMTVNATAHVALGAQKLRHLQRRSAHRQDTP